MIVNPSIPDIVVRSLYSDPQRPWAWILVKAVDVTLSNGDKVVIPENFTTDFATVPRLLWGIIPTIGNHNLATLIHDHLYNVRYSVNHNKDWKADRLFCDRELLYWLKLTGSSNIKAYAMYWAVRIGGRKWWRLPNET